MGTTFILTVAGVLVLIVLGNQLYRNRARKKILEEIRSLWAQDREIETGWTTGDVNRQSRYFEGLKEEESFQTISDRSYNDLGLFSVFQKIDHATSFPGRQYLYNLMRRPFKSPEKLKELDDLAGFFAENDSQRESVQEQLHKLSNSQAAYLTALFQEGILPKPQWFIVVPILSAMSFFSMAVIPFYPARGIAALTFISLVNMVFHFLNMKYTTVYKDSLSMLTKLEDVAGELGKQVFLKDLPIATGLSKALKSIRGIRRRLFFISFHSLNADDPATIILGIFGFVKMIFLIEPLALFSALKAVEDKAEEIHTLFRFAGFVDTATSLASWRESLEVPWCKPQISEGKTIEFSEMRHPLVEECVPNDLSMNGKSMLLTGSNMSGKTTFIRGVAVNTLLGQAFNTCLATRFVVPPLKIFTSIEMTDALLAGESYYLVEVNTLKVLLDASGTETQCLFVIDEVFKGTNTVERISGAKAVLSYLNRGDHLVFVSTHDIELTDLLAGQYDLYHFTETVEKEELVFDHKLKTGELKTRNAIRILELNGYPEEVVKEARKVSGEMGAGGD